VLPLGAGRGTGEEEEEFSFFRTVFRLPRYFARGSGSKMVYRPFFAGRPVDHARLVWIGIQLDQLAAEGFAVADRWKRERGPASATRQPTCGAHVGSDYHVPDN
jgi:hypothetical protein